MTVGNTRSLLSSCAHCVSVCGCVFAGEQRWWWQHRLYLWKIHKLWPRCRRRVAKLMMPVEETQTTLEWIISTFALQIFHVKQQKSLESFPGRLIHYRLLITCLKLPSVSVTERETQNLYSSYNPCSVPLDNNYTALCIFSVGFGCLMHKCIKAEGCFGVEVKRWHVVEGGTFKLWIQMHITLKIFNSSVLLLWDALPCQDTAATVLHGNHWRGLHFNIIVVSKTTKRCQYTSLELPVRLSNTVWKAHKPLKCWSWQSNELGRLLRAALDQETWKKSGFKLLSISFWAYRLVRNAKCL